MSRFVIVVGLLIPATAFAQFGNRNSGGGLFSRPAQNSEPREVAQFQNPNIRPGQQMPPPGYPAQQPPPPQGQQGQAPQGQQQQRRQNQQQSQQRRAVSTPEPEKTPSSSRSSREDEEKKTSSKPESRSETKSETKAETKATTKPSDAERKAAALEDELAKTADEATTNVNRFLDSANNGKYSEAADYLTPELQAYFKSEISALNGPLKTVLDQLTRNGDLRSVTYSNATVRGEGAIVDAELTFGSGAPERRQFDLMKVKNSWKIVLPVQELSSNAEPSAPSSDQAAPAPSPAATPAPTPAATPAATPAIADPATSPAR